MCPPKCIVKYILSPPMDYVNNKIMQKSIIMKLSIAKAKNLC